MMTMTIINYVYAEAVGVIRAAVVKSFVMYSQ